MRRNVINIIYKENETYHMCSTSVILGDINAVVSRLNGNLANIKKTILESFLYPVVFDCITIDENSCMRLPRASVEDTIYTINLTERNISFLSNSVMDADYVTFDSRFVANNVVIIQSYSFNLHVYQCREYCSLVKSNKITIK